MTTTGRATRSARASRDSAPNGGKPGQGDIARMLGVSVSTVSRALADSAAINDDLKARVFEAAARIGYPTKERRSVERLDAITVVSTITGFRDSRSSVYFSLLDGIKQEAGRLAGSVETVMSREGEPLPDDVFRALGPRAGCIFLGLAAAPGTHAALARRQVPAVVCNGIDEELVIDSISPANHTVGKIMAQHLMELGHRRFLYLSGVDRHTLRRRLAGFRQWVETQAGVEGTSVDVLGVGGDLSDSHAANFTEFMRTKGSGITAIVGYNDGAAVWAMECLKTMGIRVPDDISVAGIDDMPIAEIASPSLTTFHIDWEAIGRQTVRMLHERMLDPERPAHFLQVGGTFTPRRSTAPTDRD